MAHRRGTVPLLFKKIHRVAAFSAFLAAGLVGVTASAAPRTEVD